MRRILRVDWRTKYTMVEGMLFIKDWVDQTVIVCHQASDLTPFIEALSAQQKELQDNEDSAAE